MMLSQILLLLMIIEITTPMVSVGGILHRLQSEPPTTLITIAVIAMVVLALIKRIIPLAIGAIIGVVVLIMVWNGTIHIPPILGYLSNLS